MKFSIVVQGAPWNSASALSALRFAETAVAAGHDIYRLFFYQDGVSNGALLSVPPQDEVDIPARWQQLIENHNIDAVVCAASALKRGILDQAEAGRYEKTAASLRPGFSISGLGQLVDAFQHSDRVVNFVR
jgi:tRNA 2-thiouridine synthesizing protein D